MERIKVAALLTYFIEQLRANESWCGETHVQKATYLAQELFGVPMDFDFILYKHGPFSFELREELGALRADGLMRLEPKRPYGARIATTERSEYVQGLCRKTLGEYEGALSFVAHELGNKGVEELEKLGTAVYVWKLLGSEVPVEARANEITKRKRHIPMREALEAVKDVEEMVGRSGRF